jgi:diguanylate cyclase (GGDEF)-like protein/PAS domain S-box-containing protein
MPSVPSVSPENADPADWLIGGGEMGRLVRAVDWGQTPLGPIDQWPVSLRTTVSLALNSNFPISLAWGPQHTQIYNDGYWPICADKHPTSMGQDFSECWASAFPAIGDAFRSALAGTTAFLEDQRMFLDRLGYLEETFFTFSFSPIRDESGQIVGLFHPVTETTAKILSQRRTRLLRDVAGVHAASLAESWRLAARVLAEADLDVPFALFYQIDEAGRSASLAAQAGVLAGGSAVAIAAEVDLTQPTAGWPLAEVAASGRSLLVEDVASRFPGLVCHPYPEPIKAAAVLPITPPGGDRPVCVLVAGISARLPLTEAYRDFYDLVAATITSVVAEAIAFDEERKRAEALADVDRAKTAFFSNVSHEFRTPLTLMLIPLEDELAETDDPLPPTRRERLEIAHRNSLRLLKLVNSLLDFARIQAGRAQACFEPIDLASFTADLAANFRSACESGGVALNVECPPLPEPVYVDRDMWEKIVLNLISNAFKFTLAGRITVRLRPVGGAVELQVSDTGTGIPAEELPKVFDRFYRIKGSQGRSYEGSGIGLALVNELMALHGGSIRVDSEPGVGSTFTATVPLGKAHLPPERIVAAHALSSTALGAAPFVEEALRWLPAKKEVNADNADPAAPAVPLGGPRPRILWADDNADMRDYVRRLLSDRYDVEAVADGEEALIAARRQAPDLVLTDVMMPRLDGLALLRELRADPFTRSVPIVLLSARAGEEARIEGRATGADDYLVKPFSARELLAHIASGLDLARLRREAHAAAAATRTEPGASVRILVAEDNRAQRDYLQSLLSAAGHEVVAAEDGEQALALARREAPDLLITDLLMPKVDGFDLISRLRSESATAGIRVIIRSATFHEQDARTFVETLGVARFLPKTVASTDLLATVDNVIQEPPPAQVSAAVLARLDAAYRNLMSDALYRKTAELGREVDARKQLEAGLREREQTLRLAQQVARIGSFEWDMAANTFRCSPELEALYGLPAGTFDGRYETWLELVHPDDREAIEQRVQAARESGRFEGEWRAALPDGTVRWLAGRAMVDHDELGGRQRMLGVNIDISDRKEIEERIRQASLHDPLTGLPNRALIYEFAEHLLGTMRREGGQAAVLFVDLDRFKPINDTYGHDIGDAVLKEVARRLLASVRSEDVVGRLGGDEFVAVLARMRNEEDAATVARHALTHLGQPIHLDDLTLQVSPSIGISLFLQDGATVDELIKNADMAMFHAKEAGRNTFQFFRPELNAHAAEVMRIESRLRTGIEQGEFALVFQPVVDLQTGQLAAAEALIRWPVMQVGPERFIPVAETAGLMPPLGEWVIREACRQQWEWRNEGLPTVPLSVNVSPIQFRQAGFAQGIARALAEAGLLPEDLRIEVTEGTVMKNVDVAASVLGALRETGVKVALDDFGTGYSSLSYLSRLPFDILKLDQSFVQQLGRIGADNGNEAIAEAIIALAQSLGLDVVAEGVETAAAFDFLKGQHCRHGQGFHFSRPLPANQFQQWCRRHAA